MAENVTNKGEKSKKISVQLLVVLVPMIALFIICVAVIVLGIVFRALSGVNYLTDILGAIGFAVPLVVLYSFVCDV